MLHIFFYITPSLWNCAGIQATENNNTPENSRQLREQANKEKKSRTHKFNEIRQLSMSLGQKGREILLSINYMI